MPTSRISSRRLRNIVASAFLCSAVVAAALAIVAIVTGGIRFELGPLSVSATSPSRLLLLVGVVLLCSRTWKLNTTVQKHSITSMLFLLAFYLGMIAESQPRRVGDGAEYMAMAINIAALSPPSLLPEDLNEREMEFAHLSGFAGGTVRFPELVGSDGRQDFPHFWWYSLLAAPFVAGARQVGLHPIHGFTALNLLLLGLMVAVCAAYFPEILVMLMAASPIVWWIDKSHPEVLIFSMFTIAVLLLQKVPWAAVLAVGVAAAQNPVFAIVLVVFGFVAFRVRGPKCVRLAAALAAAVALCLMGPLYCHWHLRIWSPLAQTAAFGWPSLSSLLTPLIDPNLGIFVYWPALAILVAAGIVALFKRAEPPAAAHLYATAGCALLVLCVCTQTPNVNHGGTPGPSRYGLWLIPFTIPFVYSGLVLTNERIGATAVALLTTLSIAGNAYLFQPRWADRGAGPTPSALAYWIWTRVPALNNPLPEVFAERLGGIDGVAVLPIATARCEKALVAGEGSAVRWPAACGGDALRPVPTDCLRRGALCYANRTSGGVDFVGPVGQRGFRFVLSDRSSR